MPGVLPRRCTSPVRDGPFRRNQGDRAMAQGPLQGGNAARGHGRHGSQGKHAHRSWSAHKPSPEDNKDEKSARLNTIWFGNGIEKKQRAWDLAMGLV